MADEKLWKVWTSPADVRHALSSLGLTSKPLMEAIRAGYLARITRTENDAPSAAGFYQWAETVRMLREHLVLQKWKARNDAGLPTAVNVTRKVAVAVSSGNSSTGIPGLVPSTKYVKGPGTVGRVECNAQQLLPFIDWTHTVRQNVEAGSIATWTFLFFTDNDEVRSELSLPIKIDGSGQIKGWSERIILPILPFDDDGGKKRVEPDFGLDIDIDVRRRA